MAYSTRKLVKAGASSFTIALPKQWISGNKLNKGDSIFVQELSAQELLILAQPKQEQQEQREITITLANKSLGTIQREITSAYVNQFTLITITGPELIAQLKELRDIITDFVALEITEQTNTKIVARDMLNLNEISLSKTIRRMDNIVRSMMHDLTSKPNKELQQSMLFRDSDINRLYFLLFKIIKTALRKPEIAKQVGIDQYVDILSLWFLMLNLKSIGDNGHQLFELLLCLNNDEWNKLQQLIADLEQYFEAVMKAYHNNNKEAADTVASCRGEVFSTITQLSEQSSKREVIQILQHCKEVENHICNIARIVIDR